HPNGSITTPDFRNVTAPPKKSRHVPVFFCKFGRTIQILLYFWILLEILIDKFLGVFLIDPQELRQTERTLSVVDSIIDGLGLIADFLGHFLEGNVKNFGSCTRVDVFLSQKRIDQGRILR